jgi:NitT/TauT family transport system substrate-binding protein
MTVHHVEKPTMQIGIRRRPQRPLHRTLRVLVLPVLLLALAPCGDGGDDAPPNRPRSRRGGRRAVGRLRSGLPERHPRPARDRSMETASRRGARRGVDLEVVTFGSGTEAIEALFSGAIDASFIGPNPAINGFAKSDGEARRIVAGTHVGRRRRSGSGRASTDRRTSPDHAGHAVRSATPGRRPARPGSPTEGLETDTTRPVATSPSARRRTPTRSPPSRTGSIDGAWVPEPWATRLVLEGQGTVLVDEADLWPDGEFVTTHLIVATEYLESQPANVRALLSGCSTSIDVANGDPAAAQATTNDGIEAITTKRLPDETMAGAGSS